jgi:hypothetical protein
MDTLSTQTFLKRIQMANKCVKHAEYHQPSWKCKPKLQWYTISSQLEWMLIKKILKEKIVSTSEMWKKRNPYKLLKAM